MDFEAAAATKISAVQKEGCKNRFVDENIKKKKDNEASHTGRQNRDLKKSNHYKLLRFYDPLHADRSVTQSALRGWIRLHVKDHTGLAPG